MLVIYVHLGRSLTFFDQRCVFPLFIDLKSNIDSFFLLQTANYHELILIYVVLVIIYLNFTFVLWHQMSSQFMWGLLNSNKSLLNINSMAGPDAKSTLIYYYYYYIADNSCPENKHCLCNIPVPECKLWPPQIVPICHPFRSLLVVFNDSWPGGQNLCCKEVVQNQFRD